MPPRPAFALQCIGAYRAPPDALFGEKKEGVRKGEVKEREELRRGGTEERSQEKERRTSVDLVYTVSAHSYTSQVCPCLNLYTHVDTLENYCKLHTLQRFSIISERELTFTFAICYRPSVCRLSVCRL